MSCSDILRTGEAPRCPIGEDVGPTLPPMPVMSSQPSPSNVRGKIELEELEPKIPVLNCDTAAVAPSLALPSKDKAAHAENQKFGVRVQVNP